MVQVVVDMDTIDLRNADRVLVRGRHVDNLQGLLAATREGAFDPGPIDGLGGSRTRAAVVAFQSANGLAADAIVGPLTWGALIPFGDRPTSDFGTDPVSGPGTGEGVLTDVRIGAHPGFDRVVFEFRDNLPGFDVRYVEPPILGDPSGEPVSVDGNAFVRVRMEPGRGFDPDTGTPNAPRRVSGTAVGTAVVREAVVVGDFEAVLAWVIGLGRSVPFRVTTLSGPRRLVVDFQTG